MADAVVHLLVDIHGGGLGHLGVVAAVALDKAGERRVAQGVDHLVVARVGAGAHDDALVGLVVHVVAVGVGADGAEHAAVLVLDQLAGGGVEHDLSAVIADPVVEDVVELLERVVAGVVEVHVEVVDVLVDLLLVERLADLQSVKLVY